MWVYVVGAIVIAILIYALILFNSFIKLNNKVKEAFSTMDVYLKKRWDLIPNLVETVKGYAEHEKNTLEEVVNLRKGDYDKLSDSEKIVANRELSQKIDRIMALAEAYPDLKASDSYKNLSNQLAAIEDEIANSRKYYNGTVRIYNNKVEMVPNNIFARLFGYKTKPMFEASSHERENVKVEL